MYLCVYIYSYIWRVTGCDGVPFSGRRVDSCGVCGGNNGCLDCAGVPYGSNTMQVVTMFAQRTAPTDIENGLTPQPLAHSANGFASAYGCIGTGLAPVHWNLARLCHICTGTGLTPPTSVCAHICTGTGLAPANWATGTRTSLGRAVIPLGHGACHAPCVMGDWLHVCNLLRCAATCRTTLATS